jgi:hypothetical protein
MLAVPIQFVAALLLLRYAYPIYWDGAGPMPSFFYFGHLPSPVQYHSNEWQYDMRFLVPYLAASVVLVIVTSFIAPKLAKRVDSRRTTVFIFAAGLLVAVAAVSDVVVRFTRLRAGIFLSFAPDSIVSCVLVVTPLAVLAAVFADN